MKSRLVSIAYVITNVMNTTQSENREYFRMHTYANGCTNLFPVDVLGYL